MKILIINSNAMYLKNGSILVHKSIGKFVSSLIKSGFKVDFFHFIVKGRKDSCLASFDLSNRGIKISSVTRSKYKIISYIKAFPILLYKLLKSDFLYVFYPNSFYPILFCAIILKKPFGLYVRGERDMKSRHSKFFFRNARFVMTISPQYTEDINSMGGRAVTIAPMIDYSIEDIIYNREYYNKSYYKFLFIGRVERAKGIFELLEAISILLKNEYFNFELIIVGEGPDLSKAKEYSIKKRINKNIVFHPPIYNQKDLKSVYMSSDVLILPSYHEGFPRILYEAMILGTPIITTFVGTIPYLLKEDINCYRIEVKNSMDIFNKLALFIRNYSIQAKVSEESTKTIKDYLSINNKDHLTLFMEKINKV